MNFTFKTGLTLALFYKQKELFNASQIAPRITVRGDSKDFYNTISCLTGCFLPGVKLQGLRELRVVVVVVVVVVLLLVLLILMWCFYLHGHLTTTFAKQLL